MAEQQSPHNVSVEGVSGIDSTGAQMGAESSGRARSANGVRTPQIGGSAAPLASRRAVRTRRSRTDGVRRCDGLVCGDAALAGAGPPRQVVRTSCSRKEGVRMRDWRSAAMGLCSGMVDTGLSE